MPRSGRSDESLYGQRRAIVEHFQRGVRNKAEIARLTGASRPTVADAIKRFLLSGMDGLKPAARGRKSGTGRMLSPGEEHAIRSRLLSGPPDPAAHGDVRWTRASVMSLVNAVLGQRRAPMSARTLGSYLKRWGFTAAGASVTNPTGQDLPPLQTQQMLLWELLGWAPASTGQVQQLARQLSEKAWAGQLLFHEISEAGRFQRRKAALRDAYIASLRQSGAAASAPTRAVAAPTHAALIRRHWQSRDRAAHLTALQGTGPACQHWSLRVVPLRLVSVEHTRTASRHLGPTRSRHTAEDGMLLALLDLQALTPHVAVLRLQADSTHPDSLAVQARHFLRQHLKTDSAPVLLHVPADANNLAHYIDVLDGARAGPITVQADMLPSHFDSAARATLDILRVHLRGGRQRSKLAWMLSGRSLIDRRAKSA